MKKEEIIVLDSGVDMEKMESMPVCCNTTSAPVR